MMRIITGEAKGIRLKTLSGDATRPTAERVKEAVFSMLIGDIEGREVLDLYAGSGQLALEALSRGAAHAVMVDNSPQAINIITENAQKTHAISRCDIKRDDGVSFVKKNKRKFDLIFLDPPYSAQLYIPTLRALIEADTLKPTSLIICESDDENVFGDDVSLARQFNVIKQARYGRTHITILMINAGE